MNSPSLPDPDEEWAKQEFPQIAGSFRKTSDKTPDYNCLAWAIGLTHPWIDPFGMGPGYGWPAGVPREWTVMAARQVLARYGYTEETINRELEPDWDKVAIYTKANGDLSYPSEQRILFGRRF